MHIQKPYRHLRIAALSFSLLLQNCGQPNKELGNMETSSTGERLTNINEPVLPSSYGPFVTASGNLVTFQQKEDLWMAKVEETSKLVREQHLEVGCAGNITKTLSQLQHQPADYIKSRIHVLSAAQSPTGKHAVYLGKLGLSGGMEQGEEESDTSTLASIHQAVQEDNLAAIKYLVGERKADVNARDNQGATALHYATQEGHLAAIKYLVEKKADVNAQNNWGMTVLHCAAREGHLAVIKYLAEKKANVNAQNNWGMTVLHYAAQGGHPAVIKYLVEEERADVNARDNQGTTTLHCVAEKGNLVAIKYLVEERRADVNAQNYWGMTVLHCAAREGHLAVIKYLVKEGADVNARDDDGRTALHWAAQEGQLAVIKYLVEEKKADVNVQNNWGATILHWAAEEGHLAVVKYLVEEKEADERARDDDGRTPLHWAAQEGQLQIILYLMEEAKGNSNLQIIEDLEHPSFEQWENIRPYARLIALADRLYSKEGSQILRQEEISAITDASLKLKLAYEGQEYEPRKECPHDLSTAFTNRFKNRVRKEGVPEAMLLDPEVYFKNILPPDLLRTELQAFIDFINAGRELYILYASSLVALLEASKEISSTPLSSILCLPVNFRPYNPEDLVQKRTVEFYTQRSAEPASLVGHAENNVDRELYFEDTRRVLCKYLVAYLSQLAPHGEIIKAVVEDDTRKDLVVSQIQSMLTEHDVLLPTGLKAQLALLSKELLTPSIP